MNRQKRIELYTERASKHLDLFTGEPAPTAWRLMDLLMAEYTIPDRLMNRADLRFSAKMLAAVIADVMKDGPWPGVPALQKMTGMSRVTVYRGLKALADMGYLVRHKEYGKPLWFEAKGNEKTEP